MRFGRNVWLFLGYDVNFSLENDTVDELLREDWKKINVLSLSLEKEKKE